VSECVRAYVRACVCYMSQNNPLFSDSWLQRVPRVIARVGWWVTPSLLTFCTRPV